MWLVLIETYDFYSQSGLGLRIGIFTPPRVVRDDVRAIEWLTKSVAACSFDQCGPVKDGRDSIVVYLMRRLYDLYLKMENYLEASVWLDRIDHCNLQESKTYGCLIRWKGLAGELLRKMNVWWNGRTVMEGNSL